MTALMAVQESRMTKHILDRPLPEGAVPCPVCDGGTRFDDSCDDCSGNGYLRECNYCGKPFDADPDDEFRTRRGAYEWVCPRCQAFGAPHIKEREEW